MRVPRRVINALPAVVLAVTVLYWLVHIPYEPSKVFDAVPAGVSFASTHDNLSGRFTAIVSNKLVASILAATGGDIQAKALARGSGPAGRWPARLLGRRLVLAHVPALGKSRPEAWVLSSWVGGWSQCIRWAARLRLVDGVRMAGVYAKRPFFEVTGAAIDGLNVSVCPAEGLLLVCLSKDPAGVRNMLDALDGRVPALAQALPEQGRAMLTLDSRPDRFWVAGTMPAWGGIDVSSLTAAGGTAFSPPKDAGIHPEVAAQDLARVLGPIPEGVALFSSRMAREILLTPFSRRGSRVEVWRTVMADLISSVSGDGDGTAFIALLGDEYMGHMKSFTAKPGKDPGKGLAVPTFLIGVKVDDPGDAQGRVLGALDRLNSEYKGGLIASSMPAGGDSVMVVEGTGNGWYGKLWLEERVSFMVKDGWLIIASNTESLLRLLAAGRGVPAVDVSAVPWAQKTTAGEPGESLARVWMDLGRAGITINDGLGLWMLSLLGSDHSSKSTTDGVRQSLKVMEAISRHGGVLTADAKNDGKSAVGMTISVRR